MVGARVLGTSCDSVRAIGDDDHRAIGDTILVLSGTAIAGIPLALNGLVRP